jgi:major vault protein
MESPGRSGDFPVKVNEFVHILSTENGKIKTVVGPTKIQISGSENVVEFNKKTKIFDVVSKNVAQTKIVTPKGWYTILTNPAIQEKRQPKAGQNNEISPEQLIVGTKVVITGPNDMALWPGQYCKTIEGHTLKSNEYLICRVYDEKAAMDNWSAGVVKGAGGEDAEIPVPELNTGQRIVIKGTDVSFYIPPTGVEVVVDNKGKYVRDAVTLQKMEYCVKVKEDGTEIYKLGPAVVFPQADEQFRYSTSSSGTPTNKFRAIDLNELSGVYVKVTADYTEGEGEKKKTYKEGEELFITGKTTPIYVPRPEHSIISYGDNPITYAVAVPKGEGKYVMTRNTGAIKTVNGPTMYLADPRNEVYIRRVLTKNQCDLWFPGNKEAASYNTKLRGELSNSDLEMNMLYDESSSYTSKGSNIAASTVLRSAAVSNHLAADKISRSAKFSKPRTLELDTKYEGAVRMDVWPGFAVLLKDATDNKRVVIGPKTVLLDYDEVPIRIEVSTGKPKNTDRLHKDIYLQVSANQVTDIITVETSDYAEVSLKISYRVNFVGDTPEEQEKWWGVKNYVKLLTDHMRSKLKNAVKAHGIESFYANTINIVRDVVLGKGDNRSYKFEENNMEIYDVEVLEVVLSDTSIENSLKAIRSRAMEVALEKKKMSLLLEKQEEEYRINKEIETIKHTTALALLEEHNTREVRKAELEHKRELVDLSNRLEESEQDLAIVRKTLEKDASEFDLKYEQRKKNLELTLQELDKQTEATVKQLDAVNEKLAPALVALGENSLLEQLAESFGDLAVFEQNGLIETSKSVLGPLPQKLVDKFVDND